VADDDVLHQRLLAQTLTGWGFIPEVAGDGCRALELLTATDESCLALIDWVMPGLEGPDLVRQLRERPRQHQYYLILLSAHAGTEDVIAGLRAGADDYVAKPFDPDELYARLQVGVRVLLLQKNLAAKGAELADALASLRQLQGLLPICSYCKCVRTDNNYWQKLEHYLAQNTGLQLSHGICPGCYRDVVEPELERLRAGR
jgi:CheY-like chemotaxis protein